MTFVNLDQGSILNKPIFVFLAVSFSLYGMLTSCTRPGSIRNEQFRYKLPTHLTLDITPDKKGNPQDPRFLVEIAEHNFKQARKTGDDEKLKEAEALANKSIKLMPKENSSARLLLAQIIETRHQFSEAIEIASKVLSEAPQDKKALLILTTSYLALGILPQASLYIDKLAKIYPRVGILSLRGLVLISQGREEEGVFEIIKSLSVEDIGETSESTWARSILARYFMERDKKEDAEFLLTEALRISPNSPLALDLMAQLLAQKGDFQKSDQYFDKAFSVSRQLAHLRHQAELNAQTGKKQLAHDQWSQVEKLIRNEFEENRFDHRLDLVKVLIGRGTTVDMKEAIVQLLEELNLRQNAEIYYLLSLAYYKTGNVQGALDWILAYHRIGVKTSGAYTLTAEIYQSMKQVGRAEIYVKMSKGLDQNQKKILFY